MRYILILILSVSLFSSCGKKAKEENPGGAVPLGKGVTIPVLQTEKARKAKLTFDLTEVIRKDDKVDMVVMISNRSTEVKMAYLKEELAFTDNNGYIYKVSSAKVDKINQFNSDEEKAVLAKDAKIKSIISFEGVRKDATSGKLFFKGETDRGKIVPFKVKFDKVKIKE